MSDYPYLVYTDKQNAKIDAETIDSMSGGSGGTDYYIKHRGSTINDTNVTYEAVNSGKVDKIRMETTTDIGTTSGYFYLTDSVTEGANDTVYNFRTQGEALIYVSVNSEVGPRIISS